MISLYSHLPSLDLHGTDRDYARIMINDFLMDNYTMGVRMVAIIHGIGTGIIRKTTQEVLAKNKLVEGYKIDNFNTGMTIVRLKEKLDN